MKTKYNEFFIGLSVTIAILIVITSILWFQRSNFLGQGLSLSLIVNDAKGVQTGDEVRFKGLTIGTINKARVSDEGIILYLKIKKDIRIPIDSQFFVKEVNLLGESAVIIQPGTSHQYLQNGQTVKGISKPGVLGIVDNGKQLLDSLQATLRDFHQIASPQTVHALKETIEELRSTVREIHGVVQKNTTALNATINNLQEITEKNKAPIDTLVSTLARQTKSLHHLSNSARNLDSILQKIQNGKGTMGKLVNEDSLYIQLNQTVKQLNRLLQNIDRHPGKYLKFKIF